MLACTQLFSHSSHRGRSQWTCKSRHCRSQLRVRYPSQKMHSIQKRPTGQAAAFLPFINPPENHLATLEEGGEQTENQNKLICIFFYTVIWNNESTVVEPNFPVYTRFPSA